MLLFQGQSQLLVALMEGFRGQRGSSLLVINLAATQEPES